MELGAFSISLTVKDLAASRQFYRKFGFQPTMGAWRLVQEADESMKGPASFIAVDPDGNPILVDQHV